MPSAALSQPSGAAPVHAELRGWQALRLCPGGLAGVGTGLPTFC